MIRLTFISLLFVHSSYLFASAYDCKIIDGKELDDQLGTLVKLKEFYSSMIGRNFVVERETGKVVSKTFNNSNAIKVTVLDSGDSENAFKSVSMYGPNKKIDYLVINEHLSSKEKSFIFHHSFNVTYSGICTEI